MACRLFGNSNCHQKCVRKFKWRLPCLGINALKYLLSISRPLICCHLLTPMHYELYPHMKTIRCGAIIALAHSSSVNSNHMYDFMFCFSHCSVLCNIIIGLHDWSSWKKNKTKKLVNKTCTAWWIKHVPHAFSGGLLQCCMSIRNWNIKIKSCGILFVLKAISRVMLSWNFAFCAVMVLCCPVKNLTAIRQLKIIYC